MAFAIAGAVAGGSLLNYFGSQSAAQTQANAENNAIGAQESMFNQQMQALKPYYSAGYDALHQIQSNLPSYNKPFTMADFEANKDPGYGFRLEQGENAVSRAAAASGGAVGGSTLRSLGDYAQGAASQEYGAAFNRYQQQIQNSYNRLASIAQLGQTSIGQGTQAGTTAAGNIGQALTGIGNAQAAGTIGSTNAITGGINQGIGAYQTNQLISALRGSSPGPTNVTPLEIPGQNNVGITNDGSMVGLSQLASGQ